MPWRLVRCASFAALLLLLHAECGRAADALSRGEDEFLANWMGHLAPAIQNLSILDLALPGTHDTMTYDLSRRISDGSNDLPPDASWLLHEFGPILGIAEVGKFIRKQAVTQRLTIEDQLAGGVRFVDFRTMYTAGPNSGSFGEHDWYSLHLVETNQKSIVYLQGIKNFLEKHSSEVVVLWLTRHGSACRTGNDQYPNVSPTKKQSFWHKIKDLFGSMLFDVSKRRLNTTTYADMVATNQRLVMYVADHAEFTASDNTTYDACTHLSNNLKGGDISDLSTSIHNLMVEFSQARDKRAELKAKDTFYLLSMAGGPPSNVLKLQAEIEYVPFVKDSFIKKCANEINIPNLTNWCPETLLDIEQLRNYYLQEALDQTTIDETYSLPGAIYLDALDRNGTIRTGTTPLGSSGESQQAFCYVDTILLFNVRKGCVKSLDAACDSLLKTIIARRTRYPFQKWDDSAHGRLPSWP